MILSFVFGTNFKGLSHSKVIKIFPLCFFLAFTMASFFQFKVLINRNLFWHREWGMDPTGQSSQHVNWWFIFPLLIWNAVSINTQQVNLGWAHGAMTNDLNSVCCSICLFASFSVSFNCCNSIHEIFKIGCFFTFFISEFSSYP